MIKNKKKIIVSVLALGVTLTVGCTQKAESKEAVNEVVKLESQKYSIDKSLLVKSLDNLKNFEAESWMKDGKLLGIKDQPINKENTGVAKISIYNPKTKKFEDLVKAKEKEWLIIDESSKDGKEMVYLSLVDGDFQRNMYDVHILNFESKKTNKLISNTTASSGFKDDYIYIAKGMTLYKYTFGKVIEEIKIPEKLVKEMEDFSEFEFKDYLEMYYKDEIVEGKRREIIKSNYEYSKNNNAIKMLTNYGKEVEMNSSNGKRFILDTNKNTYICYDDLKPEFSNKVSKDVSKNSQYEKLEKEFIDNDNKVLWKLDENGKRELKIDELYRYSNVKISPDGNKVAYNTEDDEENQSSYIYDLVTDEKIKIYPEIVGSIVWRDNSKEFFIQGNKYLDNNRKERITTLIKLN